jgi:hypothetical protein
MTARKIRERPEPRTGKKAIRLALRRLKRPARTYSASEVKRKLGL